MSRRHLALAATLAGLSLLAAGCGGGGESGEAAATAPTDPASLLAAEVAAPSGLVSLGVTAADSADGRLRAFGEFRTPADVFRPRVSAAAGTTTAPSTVTPATTVPATVTTPATTTTATGAPLVP
jgi:hypothetical protein